MIKTNKILSNVIINTKKIRSNKMNLDKNMIKKMKDKIMIKKIKKGMKKVNRNLKVR